MVKLYETDCSGKSLTKCQHYDILVGTSKCWMCEFRDIHNSDDNNTGNTIHCKKINLEGT